MAKKNRVVQDKISLVMKEFDAGKLKSSGRPVTSREQALRIAFSAGQRARAAGERGNLSQKDIDKTAREVKRIAQARRAGERGNLSKKDLK